ncbi:hypothetical protein HOH11_00365 [Candidatus Woesearchaeota archaeon]|nr:hypothetical protein [Candidatus Woesearchaeota archaeon]MBT6023046.1 hypothetical protein [Candidatus Woesearchaeota archaeon]
MKKGIASWVIISIIVAVLGLLTALVLLQSFGSKLDIDHSKLNDEVCKGKISALSFEIDKDLSNTEEFLLKIGTLSESLRAGCTPQTNTINPQDWDNCDSSFEEQAITEPTLGATNCAMQQVADRIERCWDMSGSGRRTAFSWSCFNFVISDASETPEISEYAEFKKQLIKSFGCELRDQDCKSIANDAITDASVLAGLNNLIRIKEAAIKDQFTVCRKEPELEEGTGFWGYYKTEDYDSDSALICKGVEEDEQCEIDTGKDVSSIKDAIVAKDTSEVDITCMCPMKTTDEIYSELEVNTVYEVVTKYSRNEVVQVGDKEFDCEIGTMTSKIQNDLDNIQTYKEKVGPYEESFLSYYNEAHRTTITNYNNEAHRTTITNYRDLPFQLVKDTKLETGTIEFSETDLRNFMKNVQIESRGVSYCTAVSNNNMNCDDRLTFYPSGKFKIIQNKMFAIEYCGDTLPLMSNVVASTICDTGNKDTPDKAGRKIIITDAPTGGGSRLLSENLPLNCPVLSIVASVFPSMEGPEDICQTGITRTL